MAVCCVISGAQTFNSYTLTTLIPVVLKFHMGLMHLWCPSIVHIFNLSFITRLMDTLQLWAAAAAYHHRAEGGLEGDEILLSFSGVSPCPPQPPPLPTDSLETKMLPLSPRQLNPHTPVSSSSPILSALYISPSSPLFKPLIFFQSFYKIFTMCGQTSFSGNLEEGGVFILKASDKKEWGRGEQEQQEGESRSR